MALRWSLSAYAQKWQRRAEQAQPDYERAVTDPATAQKWKARVSDPNVAQTWNNAVRAAADQNLWGATMQAIPAEAYAHGVRAKARRRIEGIRVAQNKWAQRFEPFYNTLRDILPQLPARGPALSDANRQRAEMVWRAMHETRLRIRGLAGGSSGFASPISSGSYGFSAPVGSQSSESSEVPSSPEVPPVTGTGGGGGGGSWSGGL